MMAIVSSELTQLMIQRLAAAEHSHGRPFTSSSSPISVPLTTQITCPSTVLSSNNMVAAFTTIN